MDVVITYVNGNDPLWQADYAAAVGGDPLRKRFCDWGTLRYLFRGIETHLPFVERVFLVVARESQVPEWVDRTAVSVVLHRDFIPGEYLPLFNASAIELFLHRIPGLGERFLYFNDDVFPVGDLSEADFFADGRAATGFSRHLFAFNGFKRLVRNADRTARKACGMPPSPFFLRPQHTCTPMVREACAELFGRAETDLRASVSRIRSERDVNQYVFTDYLYYQGRALRRRLSCRHFSLSVASAGRVEAFLSHPDRKLVCINDVEMTDARFSALRERIVSAFDHRYPVCSRFERERTQP